MPLRNLPALPNRSSPSPLESSRISLPLRPTPTLRDWVIHLIETKFARPRSLREFRSDAD